MVNAGGSGTHRGGSWRGAWPAGPPDPQPAVEGSYAGQLGPPPSAQTCAEQHKRPLTPQTGNSTAYEPSRLIGVDPAEDHRRGTMTRSGVLRVVVERGASVGLPGLHPHQLRHALAAWWLAAGGTEGDLMRLAGWKSRSMSMGPPRPLPSSEPGPPTPGWAWVPKSNARSSIGGAARLQPARRGIGWCARRCRCRCRCRWCRRCRSWCRWRCRRCPCPWARWSRAPGALAGALYQFQRSSACSTADYRHRRRRRGCRAMQCRAAGLKVVRRAWVRLGGSPPGRSAVPRSRRRWS